MIGRQTDRQTVFSHLKDSITRFQGSVAPRRGIVDHLLDENSGDGVFVFHVIYVHFSALVQETAKQRRQLSSSENLMEQNNGRQLIIH